MENKTMQPQLKKRLKRGQKRLIFYVLMVILPSLQYLIFGAYVQLNSVLLSFKSYTTDLQNHGYIVEYSGFTNFKEAWGIFTSNFAMLENSLILYACNLLIVMSLALIFSYYIAKKFPLSKYYRIMLYAPHIVSSVVLVVLYRYICSNVIPSFTGGGDPFNIVGERGISMQFNLVLIFCLWCGFGSNVMLFTGSMSGINESIIEAGKIDGCNVIQEFIYITIPSVWPTFVTFVVTGIAGIFTNQMNMYTFFGTKGTNKFDVFGFYLYREAQASGLSLTEAGVHPTYGVLSALGLIFTAILIPVTFGVRYCLNKFGPSAD